MIKNGKNDLFIGKSDSIYGRVSSKMYDGLFIQAACFFQKRGAKINVKSSKKYF